MGQEEYYELSSEEKIKNFTKLEDNWNSYRSSKISQKSIDNALTFLKNNPKCKSCFAFPSIDGNCAIEFKNIELRLILTARVICDKKVHCYIYTQNKSIYDEVIDQKDFMDLAYSKLYSL